ncbi:MAG: alanine--tRNA ligase [Bacilli bacterium]|nr:alanine--tRNA ligase [Bacilli bacterium]MDD4076785.1 alanine--tRNA ligase [Bacilli bacterium]MDD4388747.1 alanine--tRNA ligase [Bacilli bacterium]
MKKMKSNEIRQMWLDFFREKGHDIIPSASLVPVDDPTLLWINAGVAPLKKYFDGREIPKNRRMANSQKCIRTNDIENVGKTARHHTFFEMLGNFSIGDYFRDEALAWAFELLTSPQWFDLDLNRLYFTVYPNDTDSIEKWVSLGVFRDHIIELEENFWEIGEGPCGPDTEIFFDRGPKYDSDNRGIELLKQDIENDRYIEIWNIVFSQYNAETGRLRQEYRELPSKNIDTGMGLERVASIMQETDTNYETDLFMPIIKETEKLTGVKYHKQMAFKVIVDHLRSVVFALADGAVLSNEGRGYVLRRLLRRAARFGKKLGMNQPFLYKLVLTVAEVMNDFYPYLLEKVDFIMMLIRQEEEKFLQTLESGESRLFEFIESSSDKTIQGEIAFLLYDTFGFPLELTLEIAEENGFRVDIEGYNRELEKQKERARRARHIDQSMTMQNEAMLNFKEESKFVGYSKLREITEVIALFKEGKRVNKATGEVIAVFKETPFYAEAGGQVGDRGTLIYQGKKFKVTDTTKMPNFQHASVIQLNTDKLAVGLSVTLEVDREFRGNVTKNHTATHLLNESLRQIAGSHIHQQGSYVGDAYLRFDFNNFRPLTDNEILQIEDLVNEIIKSALPVAVYEMPYHEAQKKGVQAIFGEKYGDVVRVVDIDFSKELCGGCHVANTEDIGAFAIFNVESKGSGIFRIEAATGNNIEAALNGVLVSLADETLDLESKAEKILFEAVCNNIKLEYQPVTFSPYQPSYRLIINHNQEMAILRNAVKELDKTYQKVKKEKTVISLADYLKNVLTIGKHNVLIITTELLEIAQQKDLADRLADRLTSSVIFIANITFDKVVFVCKNKIKKLHAGEIVKTAAQVLGGAGGGRADFAQAGGRDISKVDFAIAAVKDLITSRL